MRRIRALALRGAARGYAVTEHRKRYVRPRVVDSKPLPFGVPLSEVMDDYMDAMQEAEIEVSERELRLYEATMEEAVNQQLEGDGE